MNKEIVQNICELVMDITDSYEPVECLSICAALIGDVIMRANDYNRDKADQAVDEFSKLLNKYIPE